MHQRAIELMQERVVKTQAVATLLGKIACLFHDIQASTKELVQIAQDTNPGLRGCITGVTSIKEANQFTHRVEISLKSLLVNQPPVDILAACEKENETLRNAICGGNHE